MTTIAYKDGILAADTCVTDNGAICGTATKLARSPNGAIAGASGNLAPCAKFLSWFARDFGMVEKVARIEGNGAALIIDKDGTVHALDAGYPAFIINAPFHAIGSGSRIALGAMAAGASAEEAVRIACRIDNGTREPVETLRLNEEKPNAAGGHGGGGAIESGGNGGSFQGHRFTVGVRSHEIIGGGGGMVAQCTPSRAEAICANGGNPGLPSIAEPLGGGSASQAPDSAPRPGPGPVPGRATMTNHTPPVPVEEGIKVWSTREEKKGEPVNLYGETAANVAERMVEKKQREKGDHAADAMRWAMRDPHDHLVRKVVAGRVSIETVEGQCVKCRDRKNLTRFGRFMEWLFPR